MFAFARAVLTQLLSRWSPLPPEEPDAGVPVPRWRRPGGRSSTIALMEPEPPQDVHAIGAVSRDRKRGSASA